MHFMLAPSTSAFIIRWHVSLAACSVIITLHAHSAKNYFIWACCNVADTRRLIKYLQCQPSGAVSWPKLQQLSRITFCRVANDLSSTTCGFDLPESQNVMAEWTLLLFMWHGCQVSCFDARLCPLTSRRCYCNSVLPPLSNIFFLHYFLFLN